MSKTVGQAEDDQAFKEMLKRDWIDVQNLTPRECDWLRFAFDAGMERGLEKRGCCHEHDPETVAVAVAQEAMEGTDAKHPT